MAINQADKAILLEAIRTIKVEDLYMTAEDDRRNWFRFGAYDALRMVHELIQSYPESGNITEARVQIVNPNE